MPNLHFTQDNQIFMFNQGGELLKHGKFALFFQKNTEIGYSSVAACYNCPQRLHMEGVAEIQTIHTNKKS